MKTNIIILFINLILAVVHTRVQAQDVVTNDIYNADEFTKGEKAANDYVSLYQKYLSDIKGAKCAMYPTCSNYGKSVIEEHNLLSAIPMIADRMIRCSHDRHNYERIYVNGLPALVDCPNYEYEQTLIKHTSPLTTIYRSSKDSTINFIAYLINNKEYASALT
ncbi:MAG: membrane protein insertion efficiency factor YidD, partial [Paraprevotella sp.]|nr:membrane protein insertion efficiency factor YidD [Paraprevotella sp.]